MIARLYVPGLFTGTSSVIFFLSMSYPSCSFIAAAISFVETEPKLLPPEPVLIETFTDLSFNSSANALASSSFSCATFSSCCFWSFNSFRFFAVASLPRFFLKIKFLAYPSLTFTISPFCQVILHLLIKLLPFYISPSSIILSSCFLIIPFASSMLVSLSCAPAILICPPPPILSIISCTFTSSMERALI